MNRPENLDTHNAAGDELVAQGDLSRRRFMAKTASTLSALSAPALIGVGALTTASPALAWNKWHEISMSHNQASPLLQLYYPPDIANDDSVKVQVNWRNASDGGGHTQASVWINRQAWRYGSPQTQIIDNPFFDYWEAYGECPTTTISSQYTPVLKRGGEDGPNLSWSRELAIFPWEASQDWMDKFAKYTRKAGRPTVTITGNTGVEGVQIVQYLFVNQNPLLPNQVMYLVQLADPVYGNQMLEGDDVPDGSIGNVQNKVLECTTILGTLNTDRVYTGTSLTCGSAALILANTVLTASASLGANIAGGAGVGLACVMGCRYNSQYLRDWNATLLTIRAALNQMQGSKTIKRVTRVSRRRRNASEWVAPTVITDLQNPLADYVPIPPFLFAILFD